MVVLKVFCALKILYQLLKADFYYSQGTFESSAVRLKLNSIGFLTRAKASFRDMFNQKVVFSENNLFGKKIIDITYHHQLSKNTSKKGLKCKSMENCEKFLSISCLGRDLDLGTYLCCEFDISYL